MIKTHFIAGLMGYPLRFTQSPILHKQFASQACYLNFFYYLFKIPNRLDLPLYLNYAEHLDCHFLNVTSPYKKIIAEYCYRQTREAQCAGSINTLKYLGSGLWEGHSTDAEGLKKAWEKQKCLPHQRDRVAILGAGGVLGAVLLALKSYAVQEVCVFSRNPQPGHMSWAEASIYLKTATWCIQITSDSLAAAACLPADCRHLIAYDLNYLTDQKTTPFIEKARAGGATKTFDGLSMLTCQAAESFAYWTGCTALL